MLERQKPWRESCRRYMLVAIALLLVLSGYGAVHAAEADGQKPIRVFLDLQQIPFAVDPLLEDGTTLVQLRPLFEALDVVPEWDEQTRRVSAQANGVSFSLTIDSDQATVNGKQVVLEKAARIIDGNTMVPLRFIGETIGGAVGWDGVNREILILSQSSLDVLGMSRSEAQQYLEELAAQAAQLAQSENGTTEGSTEDTGTPPDSGQDPGTGQGTKPADNGAGESSGGLSGLYANWTADILGYCGGLCWNYYYFMPDNQVYDDEPTEGTDAISCDQETCLSYTIKDGKLSLSNGKTYDFEQISEEELEINGSTYRKVSSPDGLKLEGEYRSFSYMSNGMGGGVASDARYYFRKDGTFADSRWAGGFTDGSETGGDGSGVSTAVSGDEKTAAGTYRIHNGVIELEYGDGTKVRKLFFLPNGGEDTEMLRIGGSDYLLEE